MKRKIIEFAKNFFASICFYVGLVSIFRIIFDKLYQGKKFQILFFHRVCTTPDFISKGMGITCQTPEKFEKEVKFLKKNYNVQPLEIIIKSLKDGVSLPKNATAITFDDGYKDNFVNAYPILVKYKVPATIFLTTDFLSTGKAMYLHKLYYVLDLTKKKELIINPDDGIKLDRIKKKLLRYNLDKMQNKRNAINDFKKLLKFKTTLEEKDIILKKLSDKLDVSLESEVAQKAFSRLMLSWQEIKEMSRNGIDFGVHAHTHYILTTLTDKEVREEIRTSKKIIESKIEKPATLFAYPEGSEQSFNEKIKKILIDEGFFCACSTIWGWNDSKTDVYALKRVPGGCPSIARLALKICGIATLFKLQEANLR